MKDFSMTDIALPPTSYVALLLGLGPRPSVPATTHALQHAETTLLGMAPAQASVPAIIIGAADWRVRSPRARFARGKTHTASVLRRYSAASALRRRDLAGE
jgi:hypothetical protein